MTTINEAETGTAPELAPRALRVITGTKDLTWGWGKLAQFFSDNPDLAARGSVDQNCSRVLIFIPAWDNPVWNLADIARRGVKAGAKVEKEFDDNYGKVLLHFGPVHVQAYTDRAEVCERVVVGTREVVEEVQDPEALAAVPTITQTRTEDIVEWQCRPLLAGEQNSEVSA